MSIVIVAAQASPSWLGSALTHGISWMASTVMVAVIVVRSAARLLAEWQRRRTLIAVIKDARPGTVIIQGRGRNGPALRIEIGSETGDLIKSDGGR